jgi:integrase/recombinase XerD
VQRILANTLTNQRRDVRDRAILMLLAIYGMRSGEVAALQLDHVDWRKRIIRVYRLKRREPQLYPLTASVAEALARYIDTVRPKSPHREIFLGLQSPRRPLTNCGIYRVVRRQFVALGVQIAHRGPHALRHACAARLMADGLTLKQIGDHLGHRSTSATSIYAKVNLTALREVGDFDLGDL